MNGNPESAADQPTALPEASILVHIGMPKSGTTARSLSM